MAELTLVRAWVPWLKSHPVLLSVCLTHNTDHTDLCYRASFTWGAISCFLLADCSSPSPVGCGRLCGPHRAGGAAAWARSPRWAPPHWASSLEECTICMWTALGTCWSRTGRCARYRRRASGIPAWTARQKNKLRQMPPHLLRIGTIFTLWLCFCDNKNIITV